MERMNDTYKAKRRAGFTLVELIVVLVMLSVLAAVAVPSYLGYVDNNKEKQCNVERKAIASHLEEMQSAQVTGTAANAADEFRTYVESQECPAGGGHYSVTTPSGESENGVTSVTIKCSIEEHGETTVLLKGANIVTAKASTQTEAPTEATGGANPPAENSTPLEPELYLSLEPESTLTGSTIEMEIGASQILNVYTTSSNCKDDIKYSWTGSGVAAGMVTASDSASVTIQAYSTGTCTFTCQATATSDVDGTTTVRSAPVTVTVNVNAAPSLNIWFSSSTDITIPVNTAQTLSIGKSSTRCSDIQYEWKVAEGNADVIQMTGEGENVSITANQAGNYKFSCKATAKSDADGSILTSDEVFATIRVASLSLSIESDSGSEIEVGETIELTAVPTAVNCDVYSYGWWSENEGILKIVSNEGSDRITVKAEKVDGPCNIYCIAYGGVIQSNQAAYQVTVKEGKNLSVSISPNPLYIYLDKGETGKLTANVQMTGYTSAEYKWEPVGEDTSVALLQATDGESIEVKGSTVGSMQVKCTVTATAEDGTSESKDVTVDVRVLNSESNSGNTSANFMIDAVTAAGSNVGDTFSFYITDANVCPGISALSLPSEGTWGSDDSNVESKPNAQYYITDNHKGGTYTFTYTEKNGTVHTLIGKVVYPIHALELHQGLWPEGSPTYTNNYNNYIVNINEEIQMWFAYQPWCSTTRDTITWVSSDDSIAKIGNVRDFHDDSNKGYSIATIHGIKRGKAVITVSAYNEVTGETVSKEHEVQVIDPNHLSSIRLDSMKLKPGENRKIQPSCEPSTAPLDNVTFEYAISEGQDSIHIEDGIVYADSNGLATVTVQAFENGELIEGCNCSFNVIVTDLNSISVTPNPVEIKQGEQGSAQIVCDPEDADMSEIHYELSYNTGALEITEENGTLTIKANYATWVNVKALMGDTLVAETGFRVNVPSENNDEELTGIYLVSKDGSYDIMQGHTAKITMMPDSSGDIVVYPDPETINLKQGYQLSVWPDDWNCISVNNTEIKGNVVGQTTLHVKVQKNNSNITAEIAETLNVVPDPSILTGFDINPQNIIIMEGKNITIQDYPNEDNLENVLVISPIPTTADTAGAEIGFSEYNFSCISIESVADGQWKITGISPGETNVKMYSRKGDKWFSDKYITVKVISDPDKPITIPGQGVTFSATKWEILRSAIQSSKVNDTALPLSNLYYVLGLDGKVSTEKVDNTDVSVVYIRDGSKKLEWGSDYTDDMSFADYLAKHEDCFIKVYINPHYIHEVQPGWTVAQKRGDLIKYQGKYYACIEAFDNVNISNWSESEFLRHFVELSAN